MAEVPDRLKCALNGSFLHEAVALPCCQKVRLICDVANHL